MMAASPQPSSWIPQRDYGSGLSTAPGVVQDGQPPKPESSQATRALGLLSFFLGGSSAINLSQVLGTPLYLLNQDWYNAWIAFTKQSWGLLMMTMTQWWAPTKVRVSGDATMRGQLIKTNDGRLMCDFPERMILMANHQIYTDWLYLWWVGYTAGMHGRIYVVLKESLKNIPVIGWGMQFAQFIFLKRNWEQDKPSLAKHMQKFNQSKDPMWLMLFPEGTNLASCTREKSRNWAQKLGVQDMKHTLLPRATGLQFMLNELKETVDYVYDCTIAYEGVEEGQYAQDIFTLGASYFNGKPPKSVNMYWRRFKTNTIPVDDPKKFELWLRLRWREKDKFIDHFLQHGKFPADTGSNHNHKGELVHGSGHIEAEIRPKYWYEFLQVFAPISVFALVLYFIYGALPKDMVDNVNTKDNQKAFIEHLKAIQKGEKNLPTTRDLLSAAPKDVQDKIQAFQTLTNTQLPIGKPVKLPVTKKVVGKRSPKPVKPLKKTSYSPSALAKASFVAEAKADAQKQQGVKKTPLKAAAGNVNKDVSPNKKKTGLQKLGPAKSPVGAQAKAVAPKAKSLSSGAKTQSTDNAGGTKPKTQIESHPKKQVAKTSTIKPASENSKSAQAPKLAGSVK